MSELSASAALAGLLFVSVSVNQVRILALGRTVDRGIEALAMLFLVLIVASVSLIPHQAPRLLGAEIFVVTGAFLVALIPVQRGYVAPLDPEYRRRAVRMVRLNRVAMILIAVAGATMVVRGDTVGLYVLAPGILLTFVVVAVNAWVLLVEINR
jgi:modulator of FtsH protease